MCYASLFLMSVSNRTSIGVVNIIRIASIIACAQAVSGVVGSLKYPAAAMGSCVGQHLIYYGAAVAQIQEAAAP